ncbi:MAG: CHAT domain-containing protein, partial [Caulobacteraceae bacterium]|nr:CHAT domain-containing protein [Caulobacteraceae bacterium]
MSPLKTTLLLAALLSGAATTAAAQTLPEVFPLGRSKASGAVCQAVRDYDDPAAQARGARAWRVECRGYSAALGRLYTLPQPQAAAWRQALPARAACEAPAAATLAGVKGAERATCRTAERQAAYVAYSAQHGRNLVAAEGYAPLSDVLETGLRVVAGAAKPPQATEIQVSAAQAEVGGGFAGGGLAAAEEAAANDPLRLRARGYVQNNEWRFDDAEAAFRALVDAGEAGNAPPGERADAMYNLALNVSNRGRFDEADALFGEADALAAQTNDPLIRARGLNYRALHARNQREFTAAIGLAEQALQARQAARAAGLVGDDAPAVEADGGVIRISGTAANALNTRPGARSLLDPTRVTLADQLAVQDAQAYQIIGSSRAAGGDAAGARQALTSARGILTARETAGLISTRLRARVEADIADLDLAAGQPAQAAGGYNRAVDILRTRHAGSATEGALLLDLGAAQAAAGRQDEALATFEQAMAIFEQQRGGLGSSADAAQPYFDLLLALSASRPNQAQAYAGRFFEASQAAVSNATARTISRLAAQVASGDNETAGLARALQDAQRDVQIAESRIAMARAQGVDEAAQVRAEADLKTLQAQADALEGELLAVNPRYNQLVAASAPVDAVQKALRPDEAYAKILVLEGRSYGVLVTPQTVKAYAIDLPRADVEAAVSALRAPFEAQNSLPAFNVGASHILFELLFGPVKGDLLTARHLIYEPDSALISLPVSTFVTDQASVDLMQSRKRPGAAPDYRGVAWLGTKMDSSLAVSGASFLQSRAFAPSKASRTYLGFGDPEMPRTEARAYATLVSTLPGRRSATTEAVCGPTRTALLDMPALPETGQEVRAVGASLGAPGNVVLGGAFNDAAIKNRDDLADFKVLYFAT